MPATEFEFDIAAADFINGWMIDDIVSQSISAVADIAAVDGNVTDIRIPKIDTKSDLLSFPAESTGCGFNPMGNVLDMLEDPMKLYEFAGEWDLCPSQFAGTIYYKYFKGGVNKGDIQGSELGDFIINKISSKIALSANTLAYWSNPDLAQSAYQRSFKGLWWSVLANASPTPTATQTPQVDATQNTPIAAGDALKLIQSAIEKQTDQLYGTTSKVLLLNRQLYEAVRRDLQNGTVNSAAYPETVLNNVRMFTFEGIPVVLDPAATIHAKATGFAGVSSDNAYLGLLIHNKNFVIRTSVAENEAFESFYDRKSDLTIARTRFNFGTKLRDARFAVLIA
jgi:hypothetical protein